MVEQAYFIYVNKKAFHDLWTTNNQKKTVADSKTSLLKYFFINLSRFLVWKWLTSSKYQRMYLEFLK